MDEMLKQIGKYGVVPVVSIEDAGDAVKLAQALLDGGLPCAEITFRTHAAEAALNRISAELPEILLGAGTVLSREQAESAVAAGARFVVSPGFDPDVVDWCLEHAVPVIPGIATPTEVSMGFSRGLRILKFFPAEISGGVGMLKAISAVFVGVKFIPTGGVGPKNLADYLSLPQVHACGGSWLVSKDLINAGAFDEITRLAREAMEIVHKVRQGGVS